MTGAAEMGGVSFLQRMMMEKFYREAAGDPKKLPWHRDAPGPLLAKCATARGGGKALDVGCGSGVFARYLAEQGFDVTAVDSNPQAVEMARRLADEAPVFTVVEADILTFGAPHRFDFVFDSGCLHNFHRAGARAYAARLNDWLAMDGDFVLEHWGKRHAFDWRPVGPYRRSERTIARIFAPQFELLESIAEDFDAPFPLGPVVRGISNHFRRAV